MSDLNKWPKANDLQLQSQKEMVPAMELVRQVREENQNSKNKEVEQSKHHFPEKLIKRIIEIINSIDRDMLKRWMFGSRNDANSMEYNKAILEHVNSKGVVFLDIDELSIVMKLIRLEGICGVFNSPSEFINQLIGDANFFSPCQARHGFPEASNLTKRLLTGISFMGQDYYEELLDPSVLEPGEAEAFLARKENHEAEVVSMIIESCHPAILDALFKALRKQYRALGPIGSLPSFAHAARMKHPCFADAQSVDPSLGTQNI